MVYDWEASWRHKALADQFGYVCRDINYVLKDELWKRDSVELRLPRYMRALKHVCFLNIAPYSDSSPELKKFDKKEEIKAKGKKGLEALVTFDWKGRLRILEIQVAACKLSSMKICKGKPVPQGEARRIYDLFKSLEGKELFNRSLIESQNITQEMLRREITI